MVSTLEQMQVPNGTGPGVRRSKRPLLASRTRCIPLLCQNDSLEEAHEIATIIYAFYLKKSHSTFTYPCISHNLHKHPILVLDFLLRILDNLQIKYHNIMMQKDLQCFICYQMYWQIEHRLDICFIFYGETRPLS